MNVAVANCLVIGNSHAGTIKQAYDDMACKSLALDFYVIVGGGGPYINLSDYGDVSPGKSNLKLFKTISAPNVNDYKFVLISAVGIRAPRNVNEHPLREAFPDFRPPQSMNKELRPLSKAVLRKNIHSYFYSSGSVQFCKRFAAISAQPRLIIQQWPLPSESLRSDQEWYVNAFPDPEGTFRFFIEEQAILIKRLAVETNAVLIEEPFAPNIFSPAVCQTNDRFHLNQHYGKRILDELTEIALRFGEADRVR